MKIFKNGIQKASINAPYTYPTSNALLYFGSPIDSANYVIDDFMMWNYALT